jgi:protein ImuA
MKQMEEKSKLVHQLRKKIRELEGFPVHIEDNGPCFGLGSIESAFPDGSFPVGVNHEFISTKMPEASAVNGFIAGLLGTFMRKGKFCMWISHRRTLFPPGLKRFGVAPHQVIFVDVKREKDVLWAVENALQCDQLAAVVGELQDISFAQSQRLQLAVERSRVTGFLHRYQPRTQHNLAFATRWKITPIASRLDNQMPGVGFTALNVELLKVRNGKPGLWQMEWKDGGFRHLPPVFTVEKKRHYA